MYSQAAVVGGGVPSEDEQPQPAIAVPIDISSGAVGIDIPSEDEQPAKAVDISPKNENATQPAFGVPHRDSGTVATDIPSEDEQVEAVAVDIPSEEEQAVENAPGNQQQTNSIWFKLKTAAIEVLPDILPDFCSSAFTLGELWIEPSVSNVIRLALKLVAFGYQVRKKIPEIRNITAGCLQFELRCFTEEIFLKILRDYESGKIKERLEEEFVKIGIKTKGLEVKIQNSEEVERTKTAIEKRYARIP